VLIYSNKTYSETGELTNGLSATDGVWVDKKGNIYVANVSTNVVEFKKSGSSPICTYTVRPIRSTLRPTRKATSTSWTS